MLVTAKKTKYTRRAAHTQAIIDFCAEQWKTEFAPRDITPTVRQYFYLCAVAGLVEKCQEGYDCVQNALARARERGDFPWEAIFDELRQLQRPNAFRDLDTFFGVVRQAYAIDKWRRQPERVEVWVEKDTLRGTVRSVVERNQVPLLIDRGYTSLSAKNEARRRLLERPTAIIYIGDHDPSGINMLEETVAWLTAACGGTQIFTVDRIAVTNEDHADSALPHLPVNYRDSRTARYVERFGHEVVEVEAIRPQMLQERLEEAIGRHRDEDVWDEDIAREEDEREFINRKLDAAGL